jgi:glyceraldehyde 3-phosphate dehydrogenase
MAIKVGISGFGRIGRLVFRAALENKDIEVVAINDIADIGTMAHLLKYDSIHGHCPAKVEVADNALVVSGRKIQVFAKKDPAELPWKDLGVKVALECSGKFVDRAGAEKHLKAGAQKVIISAPAKDPDVTIVIGVNDDKYDKSKHHILSNASCTTNCLAPVAKVINEKFKINYGLMTTIHAYTNDQVLQDAPHKDLRRARAGALSMIPTTTGAAKAVGEVLPELKGKLDGMSMRVPTPNVSVVDVVLMVDKDTNEKEVNEALIAASEGKLKGILACSKEPLVSVDFNGDTHSSIVDVPSTRVMEKRMVKILSWYDNEIGFSYRMCDLTKLIGS